MEETIRSNIRAAIGSTKSLAADSGIDTDCQSSPAQFGKLRALE